LRWIAGVLQGVLSLDGLVGHALWSLPVFHDIQLAITAWKEQCEVLRRVVLFKLQSLPALAAQGVPPPLPVSELQTKALVPWLQECGAVVSEAAKDFEEKWFAPLAESKARAADSAYGGVKQVVASCIDGRYASVEGRTMLRLLDKSTASMELKTFAGQFGDAVAAFTKVGAAACLVAPAQIIGGLKLFSSLEAGWPTIAGEDGENEKCGFLDPRAAAFVLECRDTLQAKWLVEARKKQKLVAQHITLADAATVKIQTSSEEKFRAAMKTFSKALAKAQKDLGDTLAQYKEVLAVPQSALKGDDAPSFLVDAEKQRLEGVSKHERIFAMCSMYVALTLYRHPATSKADEEGQDKLDKLKVVLGNLTSGWVPEGSAEWHNTTLNAMRETSGWEPKPPEGNDKAASGSAPSGRVCAAAASSGLARGGSAGAGQAPGGPAPSGQGVGLAGRRLGLGGGRGGRGGGAGRGAAGLPAAKRQKR